jgi:hypothetical protein
VTERERVCLGLAGGAALFTGFVELHATEVSATLGLIIVSGILLGFAERHRFWLWGVVVGLAVPVAHVMDVSLRTIPGGRGDPLGLATIPLLGLLTVGVAVIASGAGALLARASSTA